MLERLHRATHRVPGVPEHTEHGPGHQGTARHGRSPRPSGGHRARHERWNHTPARPPRILVGWQHRIAAFFGQAMR